MKLKFYQYPPTKANTSHDRQGNKGILITTEVIGFTKSVSDPLYKLIARIYEKTPGKEVLRHLDSVSLQTPNTHSFRGSKSLDQEMPLTI